MKKDNTFGNGGFSPEQEKQRNYGEAAHRKYPWGESHRFRVCRFFYGIGVFPLKGFPLVTPENINTIITVRG